MKKVKRQSRLHHRGSPIQVFDYGPLRFNINKAMALAADRRKYQPQMRRPTPDWIGPLIGIDSVHVNNTDLTQPVIFATLVRNGQPWPLLIDGHHRAAKALREQTVVPVVTLDLTDTLQVVSGPAHLLQQMKRDGVS